MENFDRDDLTSQADLNSSVNSTMITRTNKHFIHKPFNLERKSIGFIQIQFG